MSKLTDKIKMLSSEISVKEAATGTLYLKYNNLHIRVSDHEPNYGAPRSSDYKEIDTRLAEGGNQSDFQVVERISEYLNIEIKGTLKGLFTKEFNREMAGFNAFSAYSSAVINEKNNIAERIAQVVDKDVIKEMLFEADAYGELGSNGGKKRKRTVSHFKNSFFAKYGFYATPGDVKDAMNRVDDKKPNPTSKMEVEFLIPDKVKGIPLTQENIQALKAGEEVFLRGMISSTGIKFDAPIYIDKKTGHIKYNTDQVRQKPLVKVAKKAEVERAIVAKAKANVKIEAGVKTKPKLKIR